MTQSNVYLRFKDRLKGYSRYPKLDWMLQKYLLSESEFILLMCLRDLVVDFDYKHRYYGHFEYIPLQIAYYLGWKELKVKRTFRGLHQLGFSRLVFKSSNLYLLTGYGLYVQMLEKESLKENYFRYLDRFSTELIQNLDRDGHKIPQRLTEFVRSIHDFIANKDFPPSIYRIEYSIQYGSASIRDELEDSSESSHKRALPKRKFSVGSDGMIYDQDITDEENEALAKNIF